MWHVYHGAGDTRNGHKTKERDHSKDLVVCGIENITLNVKYTEHKDGHWLIQVRRVVTGGLF